jgi:hypothetical protein
MNSDGTIGLQDCFAVVLEGLEQNKNPTFHLASMSHQRLMVKGLKTTCYWPFELRNMSL